MAFCQRFCNWVCQPPLGQPAVASERAAVSDWPQDFVVNVELLLALTALPAVTISAPPRRPGPGLQRGSGWPASRWWGRTPGARGNGVFGASFIGVHAGVGVSVPPVGRARFWTGRLPVAVQSVHELTEPAYWYAGSVIRSPSLRWDRRVSCFVPADRRLPG